MGSFGITCCGASLSPNFKYASVGDFIGNVKIFENSDEKL
jgi:hypothetical protein